MLPSLMCCAGLMFNPPPERDQPSLPVETVDFGDLRVQQLGSIYEGLMEHHFHRDITTLKLVADKAERRQTGTYYTPDYIVKYIVDQTIRPLLDEIEASEPVKSAIAASRQDNSFADAVLKLNICDPAMGSGHFPVEATTFLADHIVYHPTTKFQAAKEKGVPQEQTEIAYWRRRVVESCIYGVDLNPLAVELAKLSLWLTTIASDQPLNFLGHHLCCGNSLIGARIDQLGALPERRKSRSKSQKAATQTRLSFGPDFKRVISETIRQIHSIEEKASADVDAVKEKEKRWQEKVLPALAPYKAVADLWTSTFFGNALDEETYLAQAQKILAGEKIDNEPARTRRFFHWELEFPKVSFNDDGSRRGGTGFDAVIGNPPYVNAIELSKTLSPFEKPFWDRAFESAAGAYDLYVLFLELVIRLSSPTRLSSLIVPNKFLSAPYAEAFREHCSRSATLLRITDVSRLHVFDEPAIYPVITLFENSSPKHEYEIAVAKPTTTVLSESVVATRHSSTLLEFPESIWGPLLSDYLPLARRVQRVSVPLNTCAGVQASSTAAEADAFQAALTNTAGPRMKRFINTGLIDRYDSLWGYKPLTHKSRVFQTPYLDISNAIVPKERKEQYEKPKLIFAKIALRIEALIDAASDYASANTNFVHDCDISLSYLAGILNSKLMWRIYDAYFGPLRMSGGYFQFQAPQLRLLPIRQIEFTTLAKQRATLLAKAKQLVEKGVVENDASEVLRFVEEQLAAKPERADVLHDLLAFLAEEMTRLNAEKRAAARGFIVDLMDFHGINAHALTPKTRLAEFWKLDVADVFAHFRANKVRLKESDEEKIRERFSKSKSALIPLDSQIAFTDRLIDQIVYRLYGLTDAEIKLVEQGRKGMSTEAALTATRLG